MKTRIGFVSNSSSSSFIVGFPRNNLPESAGDMKKLLFPNGDEWFYNEYDYNIRFSTDQVAETVYNDYISSLDDLEGSTEIINMLSSDYWLDVDLDYDRVNGNKKIYKKTKEDHEKITNSQNKLAADEYEEKFISKSDLKFVMFMYADEDGSYGSTLEHSGLFDELFHVKISNH